MAWIGPAVTATLISSFIAALGWYVSWRTSTGLDTRRRLERVRDVQTALLAEIRSIVHHLQQYDAAEISAGVRARFASDETYTPLISREPGSPLYGAIVGEISILPTAVIDQVVLFYRQQEVISHFADDLRGDRFVALPRAQKIAMVDDYLALRSYASSLGADAAEALRSSIDRAISRRDADPLVPKSASGGAEV